MNLFFLISNQIKFSQGKNQTSTLVTKFTPHLGQQSKEQCRGWEHFVVLLGGKTIKIISNFPRQTII